MEQGVLYGLEVHAARRQGDWYALVAPGAYGVDGEPNWFLGHTVSQTTATVSGLTEIALRHPRDPRWPVLVTESGSLLRSVGTLTVTTLATLATEGSWAVTYLADQAPLRNLSIEIGGVGVTSYTLHHNRLGVAADYVGQAATVTYLPEGVSLAGLSAVTVVGDHGPLTLEYRTTVPAGGILPYYDLTDWTVTGTVSTLVTQVPGEDCTRWVDTTGEYLLTADLEVFGGQVRLGAVGQRSVTTPGQGRYQLSVPVSSTGVTLALSPVGGLTRYQVHGIYLVDSVDREHRYTVGALADPMYITTTPYATTATTISAIASSPVRYSQVTVVQAPHRVKASIQGVVEGRLVPYQGSVTALATGATITVEPSPAPGVHWFSVECGSTSVTLNLTATGASLNLWLDASNRMPAYHVGDQHLCPYVEVSAHTEPGVYTLRPFLHNQWGGPLLVAGVTLVTPVTVHLTGGQLLGGERTAEGTALRISSSGLCTALGGTRVTLEVNYQGRSFWSPTVELPPDLSAETVLTSLGGLGLVPFILDDPDSLIDDPQHGRVYLP
jgi:hypothetical protein